MTEDEAYTLASRRIDCPVEWCGGSWLEHGGDGAAPEEWAHDDAEGLELAHGARLYRHRFGAGPVAWSLVRESGEWMRGDDLQAMARELRDIADALDRGIV